MDSGRRSSSERIETLQSRAAEGTVYDLLLHPSSSVNFELFLLVGNLIPFCGQLLGSDTYRSLGNLSSPPLLIALTMGLSHFFFPHLVPREYCTLVFEQM